MQNKQAAQTVKKALQEDPTVFQYDEVYDDMEKARNDKKEKARSDKKPKYIHELMKTAERRQRENERRIEKQVQKDLEKEGDEFKDKEAFVTSAYKKKMEELQRLEEEEKRQDAIDGMLHNCHICAILSNFKCWCVIAQVIRFYFLYEPRYY